VVEGIAIWVFALLAIVLFVEFPIKPSVQAARNLAPFFGLLAMWIAILWLLPRWSMGRQFTKQPGAHGPRTLLLDASGAHWRWDGGSSDVGWKNYIRSAEGENLILFYTSPVCFNMLPKRGLAPEQLAAVRSLLQENIPARK